MGLSTFKPQLALLLPVALAVGGHWRITMAAILTSLGLAATTFILFGSGIWSDFLASTRFSRSILEDGLVPYYKMQSVFAAVRLLGGPVMLAYGLQALVTAGAAGIVAWFWKRRTHGGVQNAALMVATPLAAPFVLDYDLMLFAPATAWLAGNWLRQGPVPWEGTALAVLSLTPLISRTIGEYARIPLTPIAIGAALMCIVARVRTNARNRDWANSCL